MRDEFTQQTLDTLAKRVGVRCSNPGCRKLTSGPGSDSTTIINIGVGSHITAAASGGPRFDQNLSVDERKSHDNGIWLCQNCAKLVDNDQERYTVDALRVWKQKAEAFARSEIEGSNHSGSPLLDHAANIDISYRKINMTPEHHDYLLEISVSNLGNQIIADYHVDLEFPSQVVDNPRNIRYYVENLSSLNLCFFRATYQTHADDIYPQDSKVVMSIKYYMNDEIYYRRGNLFEQLVKLTLYRQGFSPLTVEKPFDVLQFF